MKYRTQTEPFKMEDDLQVSKKPAPLLSANARVSWFEEHLELCFNPVEYLLSRY